jgi:putative ABC transport system permease protein
MYFNRDYLRESLSPTRVGRDMVGAFFVQSDSADNVPRVAAAIDNMFASSPFPTKTESERAFELSFLSFLGNIKLFMMAICAAVTFTILLVSANTISMSVRERIREVGILKTLGFTPGAILGIILGEAAIISLIGGLVGCALAGGMCTLVANSPGADFMPALRTMSVGGAVGAISLAAALFIGLISSIIPAWGASRTGILDALRYSG